MEHARIRPVDGHGNSSVPAVRAAVRRVVAEHIIEAAQRDDTIQALRETVVVDDRDSARVVRKHAQPLLASRDLLSHAGVGTAAVAEGEPHFDCVLLSLRQATWVDWIDRYVAATRSGCR